MKFPLKKSQTAVALLAGLGLPALAQSTLAQTGLPPTPAAPISSSPVSYPPAVTPTYVIAPGDVISVNVADWPNDSTPQTTVAPDGTVSMPLVGQIPVAGQTVPQATQMLTAKWKKYIIDPSVTVALVQKHAQFVVFSGSVARPGGLEYRPGLRLVEALAEVGGFVITGSPAAGSSTTVGLQTTVADPSHVTVTHENETQQVFNLTHLETLAGSASDILLEPGDSIYVPAQLGKIDVIGQVRQPGVIPYRENLTVFDAIADSGGYNDGTADLTQATLIHNGKSMPINLDPMLRHGDMAANITLAPGDQLSIPKVAYRTVVFGDVAKPGAFTWEPGYRISDALSSVYGPTGQADLSKINIIRTDKIHGTQLVRVNFNKFVLDGDKSGNPLIQPGDSLYIPNKHYNPTLGDLLGGLSGFGSAAYGLNQLK